MSRHIGSSFPCLLLSEIQVRLMRIALSWSLSEGKDSSPPCFRFRAGIIVIRNEILITLFEFLDLLQQSWLITFLVIMRIYQRNRDARTALLGINFDKALPAFGLAPR